MACHLYVAAATISLVHPLTLSLALGMMPEDSAYGQWPRSGEIDIMEARGNGVDYPGGRNIFYSTLHWGRSSLFLCFLLFSLGRGNSDNPTGPSVETDSYWNTMSVRVKRRGDFADSLHTYGLEW